MSLGCSVEEVSLLGLVGPLLLGLRVGAAIHRGNRTSLGLGQ